MRLAKVGSDFQEGDMTPMIDMVFQLIAFFMVLINFTEADQNERIHLPRSELAKPPEAAFESPITINVTSNRTVIMGVEEVPISGLSRLLLIEKQVLQGQKNGSFERATIIIRADASTKTGLVQEVIKACQDMSFENFKLRARQEEARTRST